MYLSHIISSHGNELEESICGVAVVVVVDAKVVVVSLYRDEQRTAQRPVPPAAQ